jgi:putative membrane protein
MATAYYDGWGLVLWVGMIILLFSSVGNWGYTYQAHQRYIAFDGRDALDILSERFARSEITRDEYRSMRDEVALFTRAKNRSGKSATLSPA